MVAFNPQTSCASVRLCLLALLHIDKTVCQCFILGFVVYRIHAFGPRRMDLPRFVARHGSPRKTSSRLEH